MESKENIVADKLDQLIAVILSSNIKSSVEPENLLWDIKEISEYIRVSYKYTSEYIVSHHRFPRPIRLPTKDGRKGHPRWYAKEVMEWVQEHRED